MSSLVIIWWHSVTLCWWLNAIPHLLLSCQLPSFDWQTLCSDMMTTSWHSISESANTWSSLGHNPFCLLCLNQSSLVSMNSYKILHYCSPLFCTCTIALWNALTISTLSTELWVFVSFKCRILSHLGKLHATSCTVSVHVHCKFAICYLCIHTLYQEYSWLYSP